MPVIDHKQYETAEWLVTESLNSEATPSAIINLAGAVGSGKTSVLRLAEDLFRQRGIHPIFLNAPQTDAETSAIVLAEAADSLESAGSLNGEADILRDPNRRWFDKFEAVTGVIDKMRDKFVILCDEPFRWFRQNESEVAGTPDHQSRFMSDWIFTKAKCRRVVTGGLPGTGLPFLKRDKAPRIEDGRALLDDSDFWASAAELASSVTNYTKRAIKNRSIMEIRLIVAWAWVFGTKNAAHQCERDFSTTSLLEGILDGLEQSAQSNLRNREVCQAMARFAISRTGLPQQVSSNLLGNLSRLESDIVRGCFCEERLDEVALHPLVAHEVVARARDRKRENVNSVWRLTRVERAQVHNHLYDFASQTPANESFRADLETLHHGVLSNRIQNIANEPRLHFVEQLHEIGRSLSYMFRQHQQATDVFRMALRLDEENAYSHHYLAFNLDWIATSTSEVELHYQKAIELQPEHPWWWSRWISYLATRGRFKAAAIQWREAQDALSVSEDATPDWIYLSLHRWVARWMLHWSNLDLAENVLRSIPSSLASDASIARLNDLLTALRFAEKGRAVFPLSVPASEWWTPLPHTDIPNKIDELRLTNWFPARVEHVDQNGNILLLLGKPPELPAEEPVFDEMELESNIVQKGAYGFDYRKLHEGSFIELGYYGDNERLVIGLHSQDTLNDPHLIPLVPPPNRWYERAVASSWNGIEGGQ